MDRSFPGCGILDSAINSQLIEKNDKFFRRYGCGEYPEAV